MKVYTASGTAVAFILFTLFTACRDVDIGTHYTSSRSYQVKTLVNGNSLESCSIVRQGDKIRPYFAASVINDPDLTGLLVYLQNPRGETIGEKTRYLLQAYVNEVALPTEETETGENLETAAGEPVQFDENGEEIAIFEEESISVQTVNEELSDPHEKVVIIRSFDEDLPYFLMPQYLETGPYSLVFEALGRMGTLSRMETDLYYLGNIEFNLKDISLHLPGISSSQLIQPAATVLLEAGLDFDSRLDPYVIWYRGKNIVSEGKISEGAGSLFWKAPDQAGIYSMRLEAFPFRLRPNLTGVSRDISLPVSPKAVNSGYFFDNGPKHTPKSSLSAGTVYHEQIDDTKPLAPSPAPELFRWYQFNGDLQDSTLTLADERRLVSVNTKAPQWEAVRQSYGLSIGSDDSYSISPVYFFKAKKDQGGGIFLFHIRPVTEGDIFSVFFPAQSSSAEGAWINVTSKKNNIALRLSANEKAIETAAYPVFLESQAFVPVVVEFYIRPHVIEAKLSLGEGFFLQHETVSIELSSALTGEGRVIIGTDPKNLKPSAFTEPLLSVTNIYSTETFHERTGMRSVDQPIALSTVWNEFAVLLSETPLLPEELPATASPQDTVDIKPIAGIVTAGTASLGGVSLSDSRIENTEAGTYLEQPE
jgi:hypothetical protein